jgi:hypothetical protein
VTRRGERGERWWWEFALDELRQALAVTGRRHRAQEDLEVLGDDLVEHGVLCVAGPVDRSLEGHGPQGGVKALIRTTRRERYIEQGGEGGGRPAACGASPFRNGGGKQPRAVDRVG